MQCPKCENQNLDDAQMCRSCGLVLTKAPITSENKIPKISTLAILSLVMGILSLFFFVLAGIPAILIGIISTLIIRRSGGKLKGKYIALAGINVSILFMCIFYILWSRDTPPIPNDYTIDDIRSAPAEYAKSYEILKMLIDDDLNIPGAPAIGFSKHDVDMIDDIKDAIEGGTSMELDQILNRNSRDINAAWSASEKSRNVINRLNEFPEIADLLDPITDFKVLCWSNLIKLARFYRIYAHLQTEPNDIHAFTLELINLDSVFRKLILNVRLFVPRIVCYICLETDIETVNAIVNNPNASSSTVELLAERFKPLTREQLSIRNGVLFQYLLEKALLNTLKVDRAAKTRHLKINSTLRVFRNLHDYWLTVTEPNVHVTTGFSAWPDYYPFKEPDPLSTQWSLPFIYRFYNPVGSKLICMNRLSIDIDFKERFTLPFSDELLQIVLNKRLGKEVSLNAHTYGDYYIVDVENKKIFSPGPDGLNDTKDDVKLSINPVLLGWEN
jgi:hypothetical protein